ncbi:MAG: NUDIX domain-containing protein [Planctomycetota bacterium]
MSGLVPEFGERLEGQVYLARPSAYGLIMDRGRVALVSTPQGVFLPGGGIEPGETAIEAAIREIEEECGWVARVTGELGLAIEHAYSELRRVYWTKPSTFFLAEIVAETRAIEDDHELRWATPSEAFRSLKHESHVWAVRQLQERHDDRA